MLELSSGSSDEPRCIRKVMLPFEQGVIRLELVQDVGSRDVDTEVVEE